MPGRTDSVLEMLHSDQPAPWISIAVFKFCKDLIASKPCRQPAVCFGQYGVEELVSHISS